MSDTFGDDVQAMRKRLGLSQSKLAEALEMPVRTLQEIEQGRGFRYPKLLRLALARLLAKRCER